MVYDEYEAVTKKAVKKERQVKRSEIVTIKGHCFYIEDTINPSGLGNKREFFIENIENKKRVDYLTALRTQQIAGQEIPTDLYDYLHEYDKTLG